MGANREKGGFEPLRAPCPFFLTLQAPAAITTPAARAVLSARFVTAVRYGQKQRKINKLAVALGPMATLTNVRQDHVRSLQIRRQTVPRRPQRDPQGRPPRQRAR